MLFFLGYRGQGRLPGNRDLTQTHDGLTLSPTECARLVRRTHSINRGGLSNPCGNETGHLSARTRFTVVELGTGLRYNDRTEVMFRSGAKIRFFFARINNTLALLCHLLFGPCSSGQTPMSGRRGLRHYCLYYTRRLGEQ